MQIYVGSTNIWSLLLTSLNIYYLFTGLKLFKNVPFLNGGLFECLDKGLDKIDGFSERKDCVMIFPNELFFSEEQFENLTEDYG